MAVTVAGFSPLLHQERTHRVRPLPGELQIKLVAAGTVGVAGDVQRQTRMGEDHPRHLGQSKTRRLGGSYLPDAKSTSAIVTTKPRGVSTVCSTAFS